MSVTGKATCDSTAAATTAGAPDGANAPHRAGKYLTFELAGEEFGLEILKVREIISMMDITRVPLTPPHIRGIVNLRGRVIPVMDLRTRFRLPPGEDSRATCIVVVFVGQTEVGMVVDKVLEVQDIAGADIDDAPDFGAAVDTRFILGVGRSPGGQVTMLLDLDKALRAEEVEAISAL